MNTVLAHQLGLRVKDGQQVQIKAVSWLTSATAHSSNDNIYDNLWVPGNIPIESYASIAYQLKGRVFISLLSQPLPVVMRWEDQTSSQGLRIPGLTTLYLSAIDELEQLLPNGTLYFVEGGDQQQQGSITTPEWGDGFVINAGIIIRNNWSDPNPFFRALLKRQCRGRVVLVPHIASLPTPPGELTAGAGAAVKGHHEHMKLVDTSFTYLFKHGFCLAPGNCQRFPIAFRDVRMGQAISDDLQHFVAYLEQEGVGAETSEAVGSWYFWNFNGSAIQTGNRNSMRL
eukprot:gene3210-3487_t